MLYHGTNSRNYNPITFVTATNTYTRIIRQTNWVPRANRPSNYLVSPEADIDWDTRSITLTIKDHTSGECSVLVDSVPLDILLSSFRPLNEEVNAFSSADLNAGAIKSIVLPKPTLAQKVKVNNLHSSAGAERVREQLVDIDTALEAGRGVAFQIWSCLVRV